MEDCGSHAGRAGQIDSSRALSPTEESRGCLDCIGALILRVVDLCDSFRNGNTHAFTNVSRFLSPRACQYQSLPNETRRNDILTC